MVKINKELVFREDHYLIPPKSAVIIVVAKEILATIQSNSKSQNKNSTIFYNLFSNLNSVINS